MKKYIIWIILAIATILGLIYYFNRSDNFDNATNYNSTRTSQKNLDETNNNANTEDMESNQDKNVETQKSEDSNDEKNEENSSENDEAKKDEDSKNEENSENDDTLKKQNSSKETEIASQERKKKLANIINDIKSKPKDSPSYYMNQNRNYNNYVRFL